MTTYTSIVKVWDPELTAEQAEQVFGERLGCDEEYGFNYLVDWRMVTETTDFGLDEIIFDQRWNQLDDPPACMTERPGKVVEDLLYTFRAAITGRLKLDSYTLVSETDADMVLLTIEFPTHRICAPYAEDWDDIVSRDLWGEDLTKHQARDALYAILTTANRILAKYRGEPA